MHDYMYTNRLITSLVVVFKAAVKNMQKAAVLISLSTTGGARIVN